MSGNSSGTTRKVKAISGVTSEARLQRLELAKKEMASRGWIFVKYNEESGLKSLFGSTAEFERVSQPTLWQNMNEHKYKITLILALGLIAFLVSLFPPRSPEPVIYAPKTSEAQKLELALKVAKNLSNFIHNHGYFAGTIKSVEVDGAAKIQVVVHNSWLHLQSQEKKQSRQIIEKAIQTIYADGWSFYFVDVLGNRL